MASTVNPPATLASAIVSNDGYPRNKCIHHLFEEQVERTPEAVALVVEDIAISYGELNGRANQLARHLQGLGVKPDTRVAICVDRSVEMMVGLLGILKAGGAYVPLDPSYPIGRLEHMLQDSEPIALLTQPHLMKQLSKLSAAMPTVNLADSSVGSGQGKTNLRSADSGLTSRHPAYVIYTSGSTGKPKGVIVEHWSVVNRLMWIQDAYPLDATDALLQKTSVSFDVSVGELFWPVFVGSTLVMARPEGHKDPAYLADAIQRHRITTIHFVPSMLQVFVDQADPSRCSSLKLVMCSGEALPAMLVQRFYERFPNVTLLNLYGPTETAVEVTAWACPVGIGQTNVPIGRPIANTQMYVLDQYWQPVSQGGIGELFIGGVQVARGYLNQPQLTAERFVPDPYAAEPGRRLYKTGDLGRWRADGSIEFLGRNDNQVKVRGFRIELGEIEARLMEHAGVRDAVVVAREDEPGEKMLVAYCIPSSLHARPVFQLVQLQKDQGGPARVEAADTEEQPATETIWKTPDSLLRDLRSFLGERLPDYMVPAMFLLIDSLPLTPNGKLDRKALPAPAEHPFRVSGGEAPREGIETALAAIWSEVLKFERVGRTDNFFDIGGHSLRAMQMISRIRQVFAIELPISRLFEHPTIASLGSCIQSALQQESQTQAPQLRRVEHGGDLPLSYAQQRLWFLYEFETDKALYNIPTVLRLQGPVQVEALQQVLNAIVQRHQVLRTRIEEVEGQPVQVIQEAAPEELPVVELKGKGEQEREEELRRCVREEAGRAFDLRQGPMLRAKMVKLKEEEHVLLLTLHHIAADGWSLGVLAREMGELYARYSQGEEKELEELAIQYADYAVWQREWLKGEVEEAQLSYWREQLADLPSPLELPGAIGSHGGPPNIEGAEYNFGLPPALLGKLQKLSRSSSVTLYMVLLAALQLLLHRYSAEVDIVVGNPTAGRTRSETEGLIGFFVNTLLLRTDISGNPRFVELLERVRKTTLRAYENQDLPFERVVEVLQPDRSTSGTRLLQVMFDLRDGSWSQWTMGDLHVTASEVYLGGAKFDLYLFFTEAAGTLSGTIQYRKGAMNAPAVQRMARHMEHLLHQIVADPESFIGDLQLITPAERRQMLVEYNQTQIPYEREQCIHELFEAQAMRTPEATAVSYGSEHLTYRQLNEKSNQLARYLQRSEVRPETVVGLCVEQDLKMVIGILGILKAGGAYLPLDPEQPAQRLAYMMQDSGSSVLLTQKRYVEEFAMYSSCVTCLDDAWPEIAQENRGSLESCTVPESLAYVMYTSGSTGLPKGSSIVHRSVVRLVRNANYAELGSQEIILQLAPTSFDASTLEIWGSLLNGGRLEIMGSRTPSFEALAKVIQERNVSTMWLTAGLFHQLAELQIDALAGLKQLLAGGDVLSPAHVKKFLEHNRDGCLINGYGPTENTTFTCCHAMRGGFEGKTVPIGKPISNTQAYVLDPYGHLAPTGVVGELYAGGDGLARGYVNRPDLTAEKFVPNPFSANSGERLYRTGDLVKYQENGDLEFVGRNDQQVKIRGFRIELAEIETAMREYAGVQEAVVDVLQEQPGDKTLVAYVVAKEITIKELRDYLRLRLPVYMVPAHFIQMEQMPLTGNGKVDRKALPKPEKATRDAGYVAPRTGIEEMLASIWEELLNVRRASIHDNFFDIGGHSLRAMQMISRIRQVFAIELSISRLFEHPTIASLGGCIQSALQQESQTQAPQLRRVERAGDLPLSYAQQRLWFLYEFETDKALYNIPTVLRLQGPVQMEALQQVLNAIVRRHQVLRTRIEEVEGQPVQVIQEAVPVELPVVELKGKGEQEREEELRRCVREEAGRAFDLRQGPMLRAKMVKLKEEEHVLLLTLHHIAADGWSLGVLAREMGELYAGYSQGEERELEELAIQYADYAVWQREWLKGEVEEAQLSYWREQLAGMSGVLELPGLGSRAGMAGHEGGIHRFRLPARLVNGLRELGRKTGVTQFMILLAGLQVVLSRYSGETDIAVGTPLAGRTREETEGMIGFFVNTVVLRTDLGGDPSFAGLLKRVRETALGAYAHQDMPFEKLVEELQVEREPGRSPLFQVMCVLLNEEMKARWELRGLRVEEEEVELGREKFDLTVQFVERGGEIEGEISYRRELYEEGMVERMAGHLGRLLEGVVKDEGRRRIGEQELLTEGEREQILVRWNQTGVEYGPERCIHELFEEQVEKTPDSTALIFEDEEISYCELNRRANRVAHYLLDLGTTADSLIGICMDRSVEMVIGLLAILKAGGAYVPLDPNYPAERLNYMVHDSQVEVLLTQAALIEDRLRKILSANRLKPICLDREQEKINQYSSANPGVRIAPENLAYMIYTSGSTGAAKGAMNHHGAIRNRLLWMDEAYGLNADDRVLQKTPFSFDVSVWEFFWPLMTGAVLVVARPEGHRDPNYLVDIIARHRITTIHFVPSMLEIFLQHPEAGKCPSLRRVICSGEALTPELSKKFFSQCHAELHNLYGPTEAAVDVTFWECRRAQMERSIPIGRPIANIQMHVLDDGLWPVPVGVVGEIYIAGEGLGRGYWNRPELTAQKFIPNPFAKQGGQRMYRTGDKGRYREDGALDFLGRLDHQVKIRGFRVELGEIETVLTQHPEVAQAVVITRDERPGLKQLVAYVASASSARAGSAELRRYLSDRLPDYMVPAAIVRLSELPLMANGKLDRSALPAPEFSPRASRPPRTPEEEITAALFADVLGLEQVGIDDNFFQMGGHSLLAMLLVARVRSVLFLEVPVQVLFEKPTVADFATAIIAYETKLGQTQKIARMIKQAHSNQR